jgi:hypothetical protein
MRIKRLQNSNYNYRYPYEREIVPGARFLMVSNVGRLIPCTDPKVQGIEVSISCLFSVTETKELFVAYDQVHNYVSGEKLESYGAVPLKTFLEGDKTEFFGYQHAWLKPMVWNEVYEALAQEANELNADPHHKPANVDVIFKIFSIVGSARLGMLRNGNYFVYVGHCELGKLLVKKPGRHLYVWSGIPTNECLSQWVDAIMEQTPTGYDAYEKARKDFDKVHDSFVPPRGISHE